MFIDIQDSFETLRPTGMRAVGIDFGTTFSAVSLYRQDATGNLDGSLITPLIPTVVAYKKINTESMFFGEKAIKIATDNPDNFWLISSVKRYLCGEQALEKIWGDLTPFDVTKDFFKYLYQRTQNAMAELPEKVDPGQNMALAAVVTVPAYFDEKARSLIKNAAQIGGFQVLRLMSEPVAAALSYGMLDITAELSKSDRQKTILALQDEHSSAQKPQVYAVYDLGGGTFDVSIIVVTSGIVQVMATGGDHALGGDDLDDTLGAYFSLSPLRARQLKEWFTPMWEENSHAQGAINIPLDIWSHAEPAPSLQEISQAMTEIWSGFFQQTWDICVETIGAADLIWTNLDGFMVVGGSGRSPLLQRFLTEKLAGRAPLLLGDFDTAVVLGAGLQAYNLTHKSSFLLLDVTPLSLGIETHHGLVQKIIPRNHPLPATAQMTFTTAAHGQKAMKIHVVQGEQGLVAGCRSLACFQLDDLPALPKGAVKVNIIFDLDENGLLTVSARYNGEASDKTKGDDSQNNGQEKTREKTIRLNALDHLEDTVIQDLLDQEGADLPQRLWIQKSQEALDALVEVRHLLALTPEDNPALWSDVGYESQRSFIENACYDLEAMITLGNLDQLQTQWDIFSQDVAPFIETHLTQALRVHLKGM